MNILIPYKWLLEHLETDASAKEIQEKVSLCGPSIERIYDREGDSIFDIEVTTNRVDAMSVRGIARECAVILNNAGIPAKLKKQDLPSSNSLSTSTADPADEAGPLPRIINNPKFCKRILAVVLSNVQRTPTPDWMAARLRQTEMNVHDSVIDITNYITHELGHPCHAFDYDKIMALGGEIIVKEAEKGKKFTTLDGMNYETVGGEIVFENPSGEIIDLPAVKGTANTSIDESTKNVLFWVESLDPKKVRFASMTHAIRTTAAQLNEKDVDPELAMDVLLRGVQLYQELCQAEVASEIYDEYPGKRTLSSVKVEKSTIDKYLGVELKVEIITNILKDLGCEVDFLKNSITDEHRDPSSRLSGTQDDITVTPPSYRPDLEIPADIVEEVARIYGYHNLPSVLMPTAIPLSKPEHNTFKLEERIKHFFSDIGWQEVYTYSMIGEELATQSGTPVEDHLRLQNALTDDKVYLRVRLIPSLNQIIDYNPTASRLSVFEIANIYLKQAQGLPLEILGLGMISTKPYREVKGDLESLLGQFHIEDIHINLAAQSGKISVLHGDENIELGEISTLKNGRTSISMSIAQLAKVATFHPSYQPIPNTSSIIEDLTFTVPEKTLIGEVIRDIKLSSTLIETVELKDIYNQNYSFTISYLDREKSLSTSDIEPVRKEVVWKLEEKYQMKLVGSLN